MTSRPAAVDTDPWREPARGLRPAPLGPPPRRGLTPGLLLKAGAGVLVAVLVAIPIGFGMALAMAASIACAAIRGLVGRRPS